MLGGIGPTYRRMFEERWMTTESRGSDRYWRLGQHCDFSYTTSLFSDCFGPDWGQAIEAGGVLDMTEDEVTKLRYAHMLG